MPVQSPPNSGTRRLKYYLLVALVLAFAVIGNFSLLVQYNNLTLGLTVLGYRVGIEPVESRTRVTHGPVRQPACTTAAGQPVQASRAVQYLNKRHTIAKQSKNRDQREHPTMKPPSSLTLEYLCCCHDLHRFSY